MGAWRANTDTPKNTPLGRQPWSRNSTSRIQKACCLLLVAAGIVSQRKLRTALHSGDYLDESRETASAAPSTRAGERSQGFLPLSGLQLLVDQMRLSCSGPSGNKDHLRMAPSNTEYTGHLTMVPGIGRLPGIHRPPSTTTTTNHAAGSLAVAVAISGAVLTEAIGGLIRGIVVGSNSTSDSDGDN